MKTTGSVEATLTNKRPGAVAAGNIITVTADRTVQGRTWQIALATAILAVSCLLSGLQPANAINAVCFNGGSVFAVVDDDCSNPFTPIFPGSFNVIDPLTASGGLTVDGTSTFNGTATFNSGSTFTGGINTNGITNTGNIATGTMSTTGLATLNSLGVTNNAAVGGTLTVTGLSTFNGGIAVTGGVTTDTLIATTSIAAPIVNATTVNATTVSATTVTTTTANVTTANLGTANVSTALQVAPGATVNMGGNRVMNIAAPVAGTDAVNKSYVDASVGNVGTQMTALSDRVDQAIGSINTRVDKANAGVAMAFAMAGVPTVLPNERVAFTLNYGNFQSQNGVALNAALRLDNYMQLTAGVAYGPNQNIAGARAGLRVGW